jgi:hypothetical protein
MATDPQTLMSQANCYACFGQAGTWRLLELMLVRQWSNQSAVVPIDPVVSAWVARVISNGAPSPSNHSIQTVNTFWRALKTAGIDGKMIHVNCIAPDNYITATTPLLVGPNGFRQWNDTSGLLQPAQVDIAQGLNGDPSYTPGSFFDTGVLPSDFGGVSALNGGISVYISVQEPDGTNHTHGGCNRGDANQFRMIYDFEFIAYNNSNFGNNGWAANTNGGAYAPFSGFVSANIEPSGPSWVIGAYGKTNNAPQFPTFTSLFPTLGGGLTAAGTIPDINTFAWLDCNGAFQEPSAETLSFAAFHLGLTFAQATALFNAVQAMRMNFGSGFV